MGFEQFQVIFDKPGKTYSPGETISGHIRIVSSSAEKIRGLKLCCTGEAATKWTETVRRDKKNETVTYYANEHYFKIKYYLVGAHNQEMMLPKGNYIYPFSCLLPPVLPSSFEGSYGHVRYSIKATIDLPWAIDHEKDINLTVISPVDLNLNSHLKETVTFSMEKNFCCLWCKSGPLVVDVFLPCSGYVSGQVVNINFDVNNASNIDVENILLSLKQKVTFHARHPHSDSKYSVHYIFKEVLATKISGGENKNFSKEITIPSLPPSNLTNCSIIDLDYMFEVEAKIPACHFNMDSTIPIIIGTIPFYTANVVTTSAPPSYNDAMRNQLLDNQKAPGWVVPPGSDLPNHPIPNVHPSAPSYEPPLYQ